MACMTICTLLAGPLSADEEVPVPTTLDELKSAVAEVAAVNDVPAVGIALVDKNGPV